MVNRRVKRSEIWDLGLLVEHMKDIFDIVMFKVILGSFKALRIFPKILLLQNCFFYTCDSFSAKLFLLSMMFSVAVATTFISCNFEF